MLIRINRINSLALNSHKLDREIPKVFHSVGEEPCAFTMNLFEQLNITKTAKYNYVYYIYIFKRRSYDNSYS